MMEANAEKTSDDRLQEIAEARALVAKVAAKLDTATIQLEGAKAKAKKCKADWDNAIGSMLAVIDNRQFELHGSEEDEARAEKERAWAEIPLAGLDEPQIPVSILIKLDNAGIGLMGDLAAHPRLQDIPGIGKVAAEKIQAAVDAEIARRADAIKEDAEDDPDAEAEADAADAPAA